MSQAYVSIDKLAGTDTIRLTVQVGAEREPLLRIEVSARDFVAGVEPLRHMTAGDTVLIPATIKS